MCRQIVDAAARSSPRLVEQVGRSGQPPRQIAALLQDRANNANTDLSAIGHWLLRMEAWRYAPHSHARQLGTLQREFRSLPWPQRIP